MEFLAQFITNMVWASLLFSVGFGYMAFKDEKKNLFYPIVALIVAVCYLIAYYV